MTGAVPDRDLDVVDEVVRRARAGEDVRALIARLQPALRAQVEEVLELERRLIGSSGGGSGFDPSGETRARPPAPAGPPSVLPRRPPGGGDPWLGVRLSGCTLERLLGRGGMGAAYLARRELAPGAATAVVVKLLPLDAATDPRLLARFRREADALRRVRAHPNVVSVLGASLDGPETPHLVLEFVPGPSLKALVQQRGPLPFADAARLARDVARGLAVLHGHGILHRDIKPENVVVDQDGRARLIDFGIAKDVFLSGLTEPGQLVGTAEYMSPEQWSGGPQDARVDLFALGATLYHLLAGRPPFQGEGLDELMDLATSGDYAPLAEAAPGAPPGLARLVSHLLEPDPRFRYARAELVAADLEPFARGDERFVALGGLPALVALEAGATPDAVAGRERLVLPQARRLVVGAGPTADVKVAGRGVGPEHIEVSRDDAAGFTVTDLRSAGGTWLGEARVTKRVPLEDGDVLRLGEARLAFVDPGGKRRPAPWLDDLRRVEADDAIVAALARLGDPRAIAALLEALEPDPLVERAGEDALRALGAAALFERRARLAAEARAATPALLARAAGEALGQDPVAWLSWWFEARARLPAQVGPARPPRVLRLVPATGRPSVLIAQAGEPGVLLIGRDERCHLRLEHPTVSRLQATALRLHRRLALRDEGGTGSTRLAGRAVRVALLDAGAALALGEVSVQVEGSEVPAPRPDGARPVDAATFQALDEAGHPAALGGHVAVLEVAAARAAALDATVRALGLEPAVAYVAREAWSARAARARAALCAAAGRDLGPHAAAWRPLLTSPGAAPIGWS